MPAQIETIRFNTLLGPAYCHFCADVIEVGQDAWTTDAHTYCSADCEHEHAIEMEAEAPTAPDPEIWPELYCEFCGGGPECIVCRRGMPA